MTRDYLDCFAPPPVNLFLFPLSHLFAWFWQDCRPLFDILDDGDGHITIAEFCKGLMQLKGQARALDIHMLHRENSKVLQKCQDIYHQVTLVCKALPTVYKWALWSKIDHETNQVRFCLCWQSHRNRSKTRHSVCDQKIGSAVCQARVMGCRGCVALVGRLEPQAFSDGQRLADDRWRSEDGKNFVADKIGFGYRIGDSMLGDGEIMSCHRHVMVKNAKQLLQLIIAYTYIYSSQVVWMKPDIFFQVLLGGCSSAQLSCGHPFLSRLIALSLVDWWFL